MTKEETKQTVKEAAIEARMASAETLTTYGTHTSLDDFEYLSHDEIAEVERASALIDKYGYKGEYFLYCILMDFKESFARVNYWKSKSRRFLPHCQPFRDLNNPHQIIPQWQKDMAHWADRKEIYMSCDFKDFSPRKGFLCKEYFKIL